MGENLGSGAKGVSVAVFGRDGSFGDGTVVEGRGCTGVEVGPRGVSPESLVHPALKRVAMRATTKSP